MKWLIAIVIILSIPLHPANGQTAPAGESVHVNFSEVQAYSDCTDAINLYAPSLHATLLKTSVFGPPLTFATGEASGISPECQLPSGTVLAISLNRRATHISFNRYGAADIDLYRNGELVFSDTTSGLGGRFAHTIGGGFDYVILSAANIDSPLLVDELTIRFPTHAMTIAVDFSIAAMDDDCAVSFARLPFLEATEATVVSVINGSLGAWVCSFTPDSHLVIEVDHPLIGFGYSGIGDIHAVVVGNGFQQRPVSYSILDIGDFQWAHEVGAHTVELTLPAESQAAELYRLWFTLSLDSPPSTVDFSGADSCQAAIEAALNGVIADNEGQTIVSTGSAGGAAPECQLSQPLQIGFTQAAAVLSFTFSGRLKVVFYHQGQLVMQTGEQQGFPSRYYRSIVFDQVVIIPIDATEPIRIDNLGVVWSSS